MIDFKDFIARLKATKEQLETGTAWLDEDFSPLMADDIEQLSKDIVNFADLTYFYPSVKNAPAYPKDFREHSIKFYKIKNGKVFHDLRKIEQGIWKKVYQDGYSGGIKISIHYFKSPSGQVCDVKVKDGWSNS